MSWYVYIVQARTGRYYTGISPVPQRRVGQHNIGQGAKFTHDQGPIKLLYISKPFVTQVEARKREKQIKGWTHEKKKKLISGEWT